MHLPHISILFQDNDLLVIDKPAGVVVNRAESVKEKTIQDWAEKELSLQSSDVSHQSTEDDDYYSRAGIVHRIDKETSGCLIIAKNPAAFEKLQAAFKNRQVKKTYLALVHGKLVSQEGEINAPVGRLPWNREQFGIVPGGKESVTRFKITSYYSSSDSPAGGSNKNRPEQFTLVELYPESGRTHQIRVHLKYLGFPIVGDYLYAGRKRQKADRLWCPRVFLHAASISFPHPTTHKNVTVSSHLPPELESVLSHLTAAA